VEVPADPKATGAQKTAVVAAWVDHLAATTTPFVDRAAWLLHGWLFSAMDKARSPAQMASQIRLFRTAGRGSFPELLRAVTTDPAMLVYLDGRESTGSAPNENFGRELLELFALGVGDYVEADVKAGARALTGWTTGAGEVTAVFRRNRHDDTPQRYLGTDGVHDVDTVIAAAVAHPAHPRFVARRVAREVLGTVEDAVVGRLAEVYDDNGRRLDAVIAAAVRLGLEGAGSSVVLAPVPWLAMARRAAAGGVVAVTIIGCESGQSGHSPIDGSVPDSTGASGSVGSGAGAARVLVIVELDGGNDGLSALVPADGRYRDARPTLAVPESDVVALAGTTEVGLHPALAPLVPLWTSGRMAAVRGIGFSDPDRSHFVSMDRWWRADQGGTAPGWLSQWLETLPADAPPLVAGATGPTVVVVSSGGFDTHAGQAATHQRLYADLAKGVSGFFSTADAQGFADRVLMVTTSEFGRRVVENGSAETDHGAGNVSFAFGSSVVPGVHGAIDLGDLLDGDVRPVVDPRVLYTASLDWLGADVEAALGQRYDDVALLRS